MPRYSYKCDDCSQIFEVRHSFEEKCVACLMCGSTNKITRVPSSIFFAQQHKQVSGESPPGQAVKRAIEEAREELKADQDVLKGRDYKDD